MDGAPQLKLLSFKKRETQTDFEPKLTRRRFSGKLCQLCNTLFSDKSSFEEHQLVCLSNGNTQQYMEAELSSGYGAETTVCSMPTLSETLEVNHENEVNQIKCEMCPERFSSLWKCKNHLKSVHLGFDTQNANGPQPPRSQLARSRIICAVCGKRCKTNPALEEHMRIHTGEKPYQCSFCSKQFRTQILLQSHERTHTGERPHQCSDCPKAFKCLSAIHRHRKQVHLGLRPYECVHCHKAFGQKVTMQQHVQTVHFKQPWKYISKSRLLRKLQKQNPHMQQNIKEEKVEYDTEYYSDAGSASE